MGTSPRPHTPHAELSTYNHGVGYGNEEDQEGYHSDTPSEQSQDLARRILEQQKQLREGRPSSIDMALDMERQLESDVEDHEHEHEHEHEHTKQHEDKNDVDEGALRPESSGTEYLDEVDINAPTTPANAKERYPSALGKVKLEEEAGSRRVSLDPHVLSAIIANLRADLENATRERDALTAELERVPAREAELREALALMTERAAELEAELAKLRRKSQEDDESIQMLRTKVEESRRGLMRLQTENKRMSMMSVDTGRANSLFGAGPSSSKRASFTPLTGSGAGRVPNHRRISSVSEPPSLLDFNGGDTASLKLSPSKAGRAISLPDDSAQDDAKKARRSSAFYGGMPFQPPSRSGATSPVFDSQEVSFNDMISVSQAQAQAAQAQAQIEALIRERDAAHSMLAMAKQELAEAQDAREASEHCVVALRTFISANGVGEDGIASSGGEILKLPPLPTEKNADDEADRISTPIKRPTIGTGWSFGKLWRTDSGGQTGSSGLSPADSAPRRSSESTTVTTPVSMPSSFGPGANLSVTNPTSTTPAQSFSSKLGGFFGGRGQSVTSIASFSSSSSAAHPPIAHGQQEPIANGLGSDDEQEPGEETRVPSASASVSTGGMSADDGPSEPVSPDIEINNVVMVKDTSMESIGPVPAIEPEIVGKQQAKVDPAPAATDNVLV